MSAAGLFFVQLHVISDTTGNNSMHALSKVHLSVAALFTCMVPVDLRIAAGSGLPTSYFILLIV